MCVGLPPPLPSCQAGAIGSVFVARREVLESVCSAVIPGTNLVMGFLFSRS